MIFDKWWATAEALGRYRYNTDIEYARAAAKQAWDAATEAAQPKWRPIATAPHDTAPVLLCSVKDGWIQIGHYIAGGWVISCYSGDPSHWMPLPEPPND